ncbi:uncharacterized protein A4U43_C10F19040 [Asparagus officinalis]|uniref:Uncharacterized protein n=1 Tax=Asparagus officinalis TaxID=4686 RepID=A0A5P1E792_ASPOF|nr:uncharacterized protein A4U43_C10F19040 [Asparagus officinalis]
MGCFLACFGGAKDRKQRRRSKKPKPINRVTQNYQPLQIQASPSPQKPEAAAVVPVPELRENQEQGISGSCRKKDKKVNWHSTPFEVRLERALNKGSAEACPR